MKRRTNITINPEIYRRAQQVMSLKGFSDFSGYIEQLIRDEWQTQFGNRLTPEELGKFLQAELKSEVLEHHALIAEGKTVRKRKP